MRRTAAQQGRHVQAWRAKAPDRFDRGIGHVRDAWARNAVLETPGRISSCRKTSPTWVDLARSSTQTRTWPQCPRLAVPTRHLSSATVGEEGQSVLTILSPPEYHSDETRTRRNINGLRAVISGHDTRRGEVAAVDSKSAPGSSRIPLYLSSVACPG